MRTKSALVTLLAVLVLASCGDDTTTDDGAAPTTTVAAAPATSAPPATSQAVATTAAAGTTTSVVTVPPASSDGQVVLEQPAIWPAADVVFESPEAVAEDFVSKVLGVPPELGPFQQGDSRSGEMEVFSLGEKDAGPPVFRGLLLLRQLGPDNGWFILAVANENASITSPESMAQVAAGPLTVEGVGRGFEANVVVSAFVAGDAGAELDLAITQGGAFETPEPFTVSLDLSGASPGDIVTLLVRGGVGLETDPGEFGAIPVVISGGS
ncbi:MAG: hypothetical protein AB7Q42_09195 [Acidimicrobiia bacterium]